MWEWNLQGEEFWEIHERFWSYILNKFVMVVIDGEVINLGAFIGDLVKCKKNRQDIFQL